MGNKKPHNRVGTICPVYVYDNITNSAQSQELYAQSADFWDFLHSYLITIYQ